MYHDEPSPSKEDEATAVAQEAGEVHARLLETNVENYLASKLQHPEAAPDVVPEEEVLEEAPQLENRAQQVRNPIFRATVAELKAAVTTLFEIMGVELPMADAEFPVSYW
jgi:hypothetical protein